MSWLKSPWFWLLLILGLVLVWFLFFQSPKRTSVAPSSLGATSTVGGWGSLLDSIVSRFSTGDSIMGPSGST